MSQQSPGCLSTDRTYPLDDPREVVWHALEGVDDYQRWWPWLRRFEARALVAGERWRASIRVPMPWRLRFDVVLDEVEAPRRIAATLAGDIEGTAAITIEGAGASSSIRLQAALAPRHRLLGAVHRIVPSVSRRLHDRVVDRAFRQFAERERGGDPPPTW